MTEHLMTTTLPHIRTLVGVWAHPDDEAYLSSGLMATVRRSGGRVVVATATRGERGTEDPVTWPPERLAELRERELLESLALLDVQEHEWLGHRDGSLVDGALADGSLADVPPEVGAAQVAALLERVRPDVVVTFGPDGMTGHSDHRAVSAWTTQAWRDGGCRGELWYATKTPEFHQEWDEVHQRIGLWFEDATPPVTPVDALAAQVHCDDSLRELKHRVLRAHGSQTAPLEELMGTADYRRWWSTESFGAAPTSGPSAG